MKAKCLSIFLVLLYEFALGQVPGTPIFNNGMSPKVYTYSVNFTNQSSVKVTGLILTNGKPLTRSGIIWGTGPTLTIESATSSVTFSTLAGTPSETITGLVVGERYKIALYTTTSSGITTIGNTIEYLNGTVLGSSGRTWMSFNLGATRFPATGQTDALNYGDLYQWGRGNDGHQSLKGALATDQRYTSTSATLPEAYNDPLMTTIGSKFIATTERDWLKYNNDALWQGVNGINNPCPNGFRVPTRLEWNAEVGGITGIAAMYNTSPLKLTVGGRRLNSATAPIEATGEGFYWTSTIRGVEGTTNTATGSNPQYHSEAHQLGLYTRTGTAYTPKVNTGVYSPRSSAQAVRCIKDDGNLISSNSSSLGTTITGAAKISAYDCPTLGYTLTSREITNEDPKFIYHFITANVTTPGSYNLTAYSNATNILFSGTGTLSGTGSQTIRLTAYRTVKSNIVGNFTATLQNVSPGCNFIVPVNHESTNGTAIINWNNSSVDMTPGPNKTDNERVLVNGVEQSTSNPIFKAHFKVDVTKVGTYNFDAQSNAQTEPLRLVGSGTFTTTGLQVITLLFYGVPISAETSTNNYRRIHYFPLTTWGNTPPYMFSYTKYSEGQ